MRNLGIGALVAMILGLAAGAGSIIIDTSATTDSVTMANSDTSAITDSATMATSDTAGTASAVVGTVFVGGWGASAVGMASAGVGSAEPA